MVFHIKTLRRCLDTGASSKGVAEPRAVSVAVGRCRQSLIGMLYAILVAHKKGPTPRTLIDAYRTYPCLTGRHLETSFLSRFLRNILAPP